MQAHHALALLAHAHEQDAAGQRALGPGHPQVASSLTNLATELVELGRLGDAEAQLRRAIEILSAHPGAGGPDLANARSNLGNVYFAEGRLDEALEAYRGALTLDAAQFGEDSLDASIARNNVGTALWRLGRRDEAEAELRRALAALEAAAGPAHPHVAFPLLGLGGVRLDAGAPAEAALHLARARDLAQGQDDPGLRAAIRAELAAARGRAGQLARPEVLAELQAALTDLRAAGPLFGFSRERAEAALRAPE